LLHSVYDQPNADAVRAQFDRILDSLGKKLPQVAARLEVAGRGVWGLPRFALLGAGRRKPRLSRWPCPAQVLVEGEEHRQVRDRAQVRAGHWPALPAALDDRHAVVER
jgi:hypothetical protein